MNIDTVFSHNSCPCCGERNTYIDYLKHGIINRGISGGITKTHFEGIFRIRIKEVSCYKCYTCGTEWSN